MRAKCIQDCYDGPRSWQYKTNGGEQGDGWYENIDPTDPIAKYFEFPDQKVNEKVAEVAAKQDEERAEKVAKVRAEKRGK
jgi:(2Fe-2S) ferredoxin